MLKILKIKNESGKKMNQKEGAVFLLVLVLFGMHSFFYFFGMSLEKNVHHTLVLTLAKCQCSFIRTLKISLYYLVVII